MSGSRGGYTLAWCPSGVRAVGTDGAKWREDRLDPKQSWEHISKALQYLLASLRQKCLAVVSILFTVDSGFLVSPRVSGQIAHTCHKHFHKSQVGHLVKP